MVSFAQQYSSVMELSEEKRSNIFDCVFISENDRIGINLEGKEMNQCK